jgi:hypothetical protein
VDVRVVETTLASKRHALDLGDALARSDLRLYVDADVRLDTLSARRLVAELTVDTARLAVPVPHREVEHATWPVRAFYRVWMALPASKGWESGAYGVSASGCSRLIAGRGPADDLAAVLSFAPGERVIVDGASTRVRIPRTAMDLVRVRTRVRAGALECAAAAPVGASGVRSRGAAVGDVVEFVRRNPRRWIDACVYSGVAVIAEVRARRVMVKGGLSANWHRDASSRESVP